MRIRRPSDGGFSLIEVMVAILVLAGAAAGAAALFAVAGASTKVARVQTSATLFARDKLDRLRGLQWTFDASGAAVSDTTTDVSREPPTGGGPGLRASPPDTLERNISGYADYLDESGRWMGGGAQPPPGAVFLRRWNIQPLPGDAQDTLILQVLVAPVAAPRASVAPPGQHVRVPGDVLLVSAKTRVGG